MYLFHILAYYDVTKFKILKFYNLNISRTKRALKVKKNIFPNFKSALLWPKETIQENEIIMILKKTLQFVGEQEHKVQVKIEL